MPSTPPAAFDESALHRRLAALRRRLRRTAVVRAVSWLTLFTVLLAGAAGALDAAVVLPSLARAAVLVAWLVGAGLIVWLFFYKPLGRRLDDLTLALRVEQRFPTLNDALASTVQFLAVPAADGDSAGLRREAVRRALDKAKDCDFSRVVDARGLRGAAGLAALATAGALVLALFFPSAALSALARLADPFHNRYLPRQTVLKLDAPRERIGRNEAFEIRGRVTGVVPPRAWVAVRIEGFPTAEYPIDVKPDGPKKGALALRLEPGKVQRTFHFQVRANDDVSQEYEVQVLPPPVLTSLGKLPSPQLQFTFPGYTGLPSPQVQTPGVGNIDAPAGTFVVLRAAADRELGAAWVEYLPEPKTLTPASCLLPLGACDLASL